MDFAAAPLLDVVCNYNQCSTKTKWITDPIAKYWHSYQNIVAPPLFYFCSAAPSGLLHGPLVQ